MLTTKENLTELLLRLCYNCSDVQYCETEQKCKQCFQEIMEEHAVIEQDPAEADMQELFRLYAY